MPAALIVEDHPLYRDALSQLLARDFEVNAVASAEEALRLANPGLRLILLDPGLPGIKGAEAISALRRHCPDAVLLVISASEDRREAMAAFRAGALAFISKAASTTVVSDVVRRACAGELREPAWVTPSGTAAVAEAPLPELTPRQLEILGLLCQGHPNKEIGLRIGLAEVTVKMHVSALFRTLGVANRTQAVLAARRLGMV